MKKIRRLISHAIALLFGIACAKPPLSPDDEATYFAELQAAEEMGRTCRESADLVAAVEYSWRSRFSVPLKERHINCEGRR